MELVNSLGNTLNRNSAYTADPSSSSEAGGSKGFVKSANDVSAAILDIFKCSLMEVESYLTTYEAKLKLEEDYVKGLRVMIDKSKDSLIKLDARIASSMYIEPGGAQLPRARQAWKMIRDNYLKELDARLTYMETLRQGVIVPLIAYRDAQERIRKRVKDDLKTSIGRYDEMRNSTVPRTKKIYEKRCDEVEQMRLQQQAIEDQRTLLSPPQVAMSQQPSNAGSSRDISSPTLSSTPLDGEGELEEKSPTSTDATSPRRSLSFQLRGNHGHSRKESATTSDKSSSFTTSAGPSPKMSGDASAQLSPPPGEKKGHFLDALRSKENWDAARKEAPKKFNALLTRMREGGGGNEKGSDAGMLSTSPHSDGSSAGTGGGLGIALGGGSGSIKTTHNIALKNVKAKREAEEADQTYRKAVFDLETLRLRREKTVSAAITSVVEGRRELYITCQAIWLQAERSTLSFAHTLLNSSEQITEVLQTSLDTLDDELKRVELRVPSLAEVDEGRLRYVNYYFGECKDLIFGVSLIDYAFNRAQHAPPSLGPSKVEAPLIVRKCITFIEERALTQAGIYRISAKHTAIQNLAHSLERDEERFEFNPSQDEPATVGGVLKLYLRQLPEAVMPIPWEERVRYTHERQEQIQSGFAALKSRIRRLPAINQATLKLIVEHLARVASFSDQNKMTVPNLSIVFGPLLLSQADHETTSIAAAMEEDRVTEDLILYCHDIFDLSHAGAPVLPPLNSTPTKIRDSDLDVDSTTPTTVQPSQDNDEEIPLGRSGTLKTSDLNTQSFSVMRGGSLRRSNAVTKSNVVDPEARQANDKMQFTPEEGTVPVKIPNDSKREVSIQPLVEAQTLAVDAQPTAISNSTQYSQVPHLVVRNPEPEPETLGNTKDNRSSLANNSAAAMYEA